MPEGGSGLIYNKYFLFTLLVDSVVFSKVKLFVGEYYCCCCCCIYVVKERELISVLFGIIVP